MTNSEPLSAATLTAIEARANAATPAPWILDEGGNWPGVITEEGNWIVADWGAWLEGAECLADAAFVAASRTDIPALLAEVHRLRTLIGENGETK